MKKYVIFGAGQFGRQAYKEFGEQVAFFVDNNQKLWGKYIDGVEIKPVKTVLGGDYKILIASRNYDVMEMQLHKMGIIDYILYIDDNKAYYTTDELIFNPYAENESRDLDENAFIENTKNNLSILTVNKRVEELYGKNLLFNHIEIETINRCNGGCEFCPVSVRNESRELQEMSDELFDKIINELGEMNYSGKLALFSNNEPFLDKKIIERHKIARTKVPNARMHLFTNGTLMGLKEFVAIMEYLDELVIDNYNQDLELIPNCIKIADFCEINPKYKSRVTIVLRKPKEILTTRGGVAPNRKKKVSYGEYRCLNPFRQIIVRPDGKVSLCCNDALGKVTLGDLREQTIKEVWYGDKFADVRKRLFNGRKNYRNCEFCDTFSLQ